MEKHLESLQKAIHNMRISDHMLYVTYPVIKDKRLLLKALDQVSDSVILIINSILQYDYLNKRIELSKDNPKVNFEVFKEKCAKRYNILSEEISDINELFYLVEQHRKSPMEFTRREKIVIMNDNLKTSVMDPEKLKKYLNLSKTLINKAKFGMSIT
jgi:hypothetical protein